MTSSSCPRARIRAAVPEPAEQMVARAGPQAAEARTAGPAGRAGRAPVARRTPKVALQQAVWPRAPQERARTTQAPTTQLPQATRTASRARPQPGTPRERQPWVPKAIQARVAASEAHRAPRAGSYCCPGSPSPPGAAELIEPDADSLRNEKSAFPHHTRRGVRRVAGRNGARVAGRAVHQRGVGQVVGEETGCA